MYRKVGRVVLHVWPLALALALVGGYALASIPDSKGVIHGCYATTGGALRVIDTSRGQTCTASEKAVNWNQRAATESHIAVVDRHTEQPCNDETSYMPANCFDHRLDSVFLEPSRYPSVTKFDLDASYSIATLSTGCLRLFDYTANRAHRRFREMCNQPRSRQRSESLNRSLEDSLFLGRAHSLGWRRQQVEMLGWAVMVNALTMTRHRAAEGLEAAA